MKNLFIAGIIIVIALVAANEFVLKKSDVKEGTSTGEAVIGGPFTLTDQRGNKVSDADFKGKFMLVFFGFANCPAICPADLAIMSAALNELGANADKVAAVFITVDPERDTVESLKTYMENFHPSIYALTGSRPEIDKVLGEYKIYAKKIENEMMEGYMYDHSAYIYLMGKDGKYMTHFAHNTPADQIVSKIRENLQ